MQPSSPNRAANGWHIGKSKKAQDAIRYYFVRQPEKKDRIVLRSQEQQILNILQSFYPNGLTRKQLIEAMRGIVITTQPMSRCLTLGQMKLIKFGLVDLRATQHVPLTENPANCSICGWTLNGAKVCEACTYGFPPDFPK